MKALILLALVAAARAGVVLQPVPQPIVSAPYRAQDVWGNYNFAFNGKPTIGSSWRKESGDAAGNTVGSYGLTDAYGPVRINYGADTRGYSGSVASNGQGTASSSQAGVHINAPSGPTGPYIGGGGYDARFGLAVPSGVPGAAITDSSPYVVPSRVAVAVRAPVVPGHVAVSGPAPVNVGFSAPASPFGPVASLAPAYGAAAAPYDTSFEDSNPGAPAASAYGTGRGGRAANFVDAANAAPTSSEHREGPAGHAGNLADPAAVAAQVVPANGAAPASHSANATDEASDAAAARAYGFVRLAVDAKFAKVATGTPAAHASAPPSLGANFTDAATDAAAARAWGFTRLAQEAKFAKFVARAQAAPAYAAAYPG
ncbi:uncharacterized protein LOC144099193 [Amblyomma americanum]